MNSTSFWLIVACIAGGILYASGEVLMPFIVSLALAYIVSPAAYYLENKCRVPRWIAALLLVICMVTIFILLWVLVLPIAYEQVMSFIQSIPRYQLYLKAQLLPLVKEHLNKIDSSFAKNVPQLLDKAFDVFLNETVVVANKIWRSWFVVVDVLVIFILVPVFTFYFIKDWRAINMHIKSIVSPSKKKYYERLVGEINKVLSGFIRSQTIVCLILATYYSTALSIVNVDFGVFIGITTGILSFVPFVGVLGGLIVATISAYFKFHSVYGLLPVAIVFFIGMIIDNLLAALFTGNKVGLHPLWVMFFILLGGQFFGFKGVLFAVPIGAVIAVIVRFMLDIRSTRQVR